MTSAFAVFPNQGVHMQPYSVLKVTDRAGNVLEENRPEPKDAIRADTAYVMTNLLRGVVQRGTATKAASLNWPVGGKTGTTDDYTDAWFVGLRPGHHDRRLDRAWIRRSTIGRNMTGAEAALPIWMDVMKAWIGDRKEPPKFEPPGNIVFVSVDKGGALGGGSRDSRRDLRGVHRRAPSRAGCGETRQGRREKAEGRNDFSFLPSAFSLLPLPASVFVSGRRLPQRPDAFFIR